MMRRRARQPLHHALAIVLLLLTLGTPAASQSSPSNLGDLKLKLAEYKRSGAYERDLAKALSRADKFIAKRAAKVSKPAIILDIDETSLSNWPQISANDYGYIPAGSCDALPQGPCGAKSWEQSSRGEAIGPTLALYKHAQSLGVSIFFVTGRREDERAATEENLRKVGYAGSAGVLLRPVGDTGPVSVFKTGERRKIAAQGFTIIANIGDQPSDLSGGYAEKTFLVPNPFYRIP